MTLIDHFKPKPPQDGQTRLSRGNNNLPRVAKLPPEPPPSLRPVHVEEFADEAKRAAQRYLDQVTELEVLKEEADAWRNRCHVFELQIEELKKDQQRLIAELDEHKATLAVIAAQYSIASRVFLDGVTTIAQLGGNVKSQARVNMPALAAAIEENPGDPIDPVTPQAEQAPPSGD
jgi:hypothetical protein